MKLKLFLAIGLAGLLVNCTATPKKATRSVEPQTHSFAIYLVARSAPDQPWDAATIGDLAALPLAAKPVISDDDILSYDFANHTFVVKRAALSRLPQPPVFHTPFVVVADGQRIYLGAFATLLSSISTSVPTILVDFRSRTNVLRIDHGYPAPEAGPDPRSDERIRKALSELKKLD